MLDLSFLQDTLVNQTATEMISNEEDILGTISPREILIFVIALVAAYLAGLIIAQYLKRRFSYSMKPDHLGFLIRAERVALILIVFIASVPNLFNLSLSILGLILLAAAVIIALSSQKVIGNIVAGLTLQYERPIGSGDFVTINGNQGTVEEMRILSTTIRTTDGVRVRIPNDELYTASVANYHANVARRFDFEIGIRYEDNPEKAVAIIRDILENYPFALKNPAPLVFVSEIGESSIKIKTHVWFPSVWANTRDDVFFNTSILAAIKEQLEREGMAFPFPQRTIWFANDPGNSGEAPR
ncbi:MAG: mechanosensitive ion channel family protein [Methanoregulaceae archaeon]